MRYDKHGGNRLFIREGGSVATARSHLSAKK